MAIGMAARRVGGTALAAGILATSLVGGTVAAQDAPACDAVQFGTAIIRCENFYTDFWPVINGQLNALYREGQGHRRRQARDLGLVSPVGRGDRRVQRALPRTSPWRPRASSSRWRTPS